MMTRGRGGVWLPPENDDVIYEQPLRFVEVNRISNWLQLPDSWKLLQTNCAGREASLKESSKRGGEFEAVSSLEVCFVCCTHVQIRKFLS